MVICAEDRGALVGIGGRLAEHLSHSQINVDHLLKHGYQVFPVLPSATCDDLRAALDAEVKMSGDRFSPDRVGRRGSGHWPSVWRAREAIDAFWRAMFGGEESVVHAFEGFAHTVPSRQTKLWLHIDQPIRSENCFDALQGLLCLADVPSDGYTTCVCHCDDAQALLSEVRQRCMHGDEAASASPSPRVHFFSRAEAKWLQERCRLVRPALKRGDLLLWAAGLPHCALGGAWARRAVFVSAVPRSLCSEAELVLRRDAANRGLTSNFDVVCRAGADGGGLRASLRGGDQSWPRGLPPFVPYDDPAASAQQRRRAAMLGFHLSRAEEEQIEETGAGSPAQGPPARVMLERIIAEVAGGA